MASKRTYQDNDGDWIKEFAPYDAMTPLYLRGHLRSASPSDKIEAERQADEDLSELFIRHPEVKEVSEGVSEEDGVFSMYTSLVGSESRYPSIKTEGIDSKDLRQQVRDLDMSEKREAAETVGRVLGDLHVRGLSHGDPKLDNFFYSEESGIIPFDFENYNTDATLDHMRDDISIFDSNIRTLQPETYENMKEAFKSGYLEEVAYDPDEHIHTFEDASYNSGFLEDDALEGESHEPEFPPGNHPAGPEYPFERTDEYEDEWEDFLDDEMDGIDAIKAGRGLWPYSMFEMAGGYTRREHVKSFLENAKGATQNSV